MAKLLTDDEKARSVLAIFARFDSRPGEALRPNNFVALAAEMGLRTSDIGEGIKHGQSQGWFEDGENHSVKLTESGFAEIPDGSGSSG